MAIMLKTKELKNKQKMFSYPGKNCLAVRMEWVNAETDDKLIVVSKYDFKKPGHTDPSGRKKKEKDGSVCRPNRNPPKLKEYKNKNSLKIRVRIV